MTGIDTAALFTEAAAHYGHRMSYPEPLLAVLVERFGLTQGARVIDVGCGPGLLALPLARAGATVLGIDPNPDMLDAGRRAAEDAGLPVRFATRAAETLSAADGPVRLVTFGRSFHWTDRARVLAILDTVIEPSGGLAILHEDRAQRAATESGRVIETMKREWVDDDLPTRNRASDTALLAASAFRRVERTTATVPRRWSVEEIVGQQLSTSYFNPGRLDGRRAAFEAELRSRLLAARPDGRFEEELRFVATLAWRG